MKAGCMQCVCQVAQHMGGSPVIDGNINILQCVAHCCTLVMTKCELSLIRYVCSLPVCMHPPLLCVMQLSVHHVASSSGLRPIVLPACQTR